MVKKTFYASFLGLVLVAACFGQHSETLDPVRKEIFLTEPNTPLLDLKADEVRLFTVGEWKAKGEDYPDVEKALLHYHRTAAYTGQDPDVYFEKRKEALKELIEATEGKNGAALLQLRKQAQSKLAYLNDLPNPWHPWISKPQILIEHITPEALPVRNHYWYETLDPLRRYSDPQKHYADLWKVSDVPNYFIFLETVEYDPILQKYRPNNKQKKVLQNDREREPFHITFKEGKAYLDGKLLDSSESVSDHASVPAFIYVLGMDGEFYGHSHGNFSHASFFAASPVLGAGEIVAKEGKILSINNKSGHYWPQLPHFLHTLQVLKEKLGTLEGIKVNIFQYDKTGVLLWYGVTATFDAEEFLKNKGVAVALDADSGWTPLHVAVWNNYLALADQVHRSEWLNKQDERGNTPLHLAAKQQREEWAKKLIRWGADPSLENSEGKTPLQIAVDNGDIDIVRVLSKDRDLYLRAAAKAGREELFKEYIKQGADPAAVDEKGNTLLHAAINPENKEFVKALWPDYFAPLLEAENQSGERPVHLAAKKGNRAILKMLIEKGAEITAVDNNGNTILHDAVLSGNDDTALYILSLDQGGLLHQKNKDGATALHLAVGNSNLAVLNALLAKGLSIEDEDYNGETPIFYAIRAGGDKGHLSLVWLFKNHVNSRHFNHAGEAPVHLAASTDKEAFIRLLSYSDDIDLPDLCTGQKI